MHFGYVHNNITLSITVNDRSKSELIECIEELHRISERLDLAIQDLEEKNDCSRDPQGL